MPEWNQGYFSEITYMKNVFNELSPAYLNFCLALSGQATTDLSKPFTYAELGAGFGLSSLGLAVMYPQGRFFSVDFNPSQTAWTQKVASAAGLTNIRIFERSFSQMLDEDLPPLDYVVLHGIYSWVTPEVRADIRNFIVKFLKPGGTVYLSYNCQPGWNAAEPMRDFLMALGQNMNKDPRAALSQGVNFLKEVENAGGLYFKTVVSASSYLDTWTKADPSYLLGELFCQEHRAFPFSEIVSDMAEAKTVYAGSVDTTNYLDEAITPQPFRKCLDQVAGNLVLKETAKGLLYNTAFRRDIFVKGPQALDRPQGEAALKQKSLALVGKRVPLAEKIAVKGIELTPKPEVYNPILDLLDQGPATLGEVMEKTSLNISQVAQAAALMLALGWVHVLEPETTPETAERVKAFNLTLDEVLGSEVFGHVLSRYGYWRTFGLLERLYFLARIRGQEPEAFITETCRARGWKVMREQKEVGSQDEAHQAIKEAIDKVAEQSPWLNKRLWGEEG